MSSSPSLHNLILNLDNGEGRVYIQILSVSEQCIQIWIGKGQNPTLENLAVAIPDKENKRVPVATKSEDQ